MLFYSLLLLSIFIQKYETQPYEVLRQFDQTDQIELRFYPAAMMVAIESPKARNGNFNALFRYISGNNEAQEKIAMTTPVYMSSTAQTQRMAFVLPQKYMHTAPLPKDEGMELKKTSPGYFMAIRFGGYSSAEKVAFYTQKLRSTLASEGYKTKGAPALLSYDAPYKFYNRRNEILIEVERPQGQD